MDKKTFDYMSQRVIKYDKLEDEKKILLDLKRDLDFTGLRIGTNHGSEVLHGETEEKFNLGIRTLIDERITEIENEQEAI